MSLLGPAMRCVRRAVALSEGQRPFMRLGIAASINRMWGEPIPALLGLVDAVLPDGEEELLDTMDGAGVIMGDALFERLHGAPPTVTTVQVPR